jgi:hypothetical protein
MSKKVNYRKDIIDYDQGKKSLYCREKYNIDPQTGLGVFTQGFKVRVYLAVNGVSAASVIKHLAKENITVGSYFNRLSGALKKHEIRLVIDFVNEASTNKSQAQKIEVKSHPFGAEKKIYSIDELEGLFLKKYAQHKIKNFYTSPILELIDWSQSLYSNSGEEYNETYLKGELNRHVTSGEKLTLLQANYPSLHKRLILNRFLTNFHDKTKINVISIDLSSDYKSVISVLKYILLKLNVDLTSLKAASTLTDYFKILGLALENRKILFVFFGYTDSNYNSNDYINTSPTSQKNWPKLLDILFQIDTLIDVDLQVLLTTNSINNVFNSLPFKPATISLRTNIMTSKVATNPGFVGSFISSIHDRSIIDNKSVDFLLNLESNFDRALVIFLNNKIIKTILLNSFYENGINHLKFLLTALSFVSKDDVLKCNNSLNSDFKIHELVKFTSRPLLLLLTTLCLSEGGINRQDLRLIKRKYINKGLLNNDEFMPGTAAYYLKSRSPEEINVISSLLSYNSENDKVYLGDEHLRQFFAAEAKLYYQNNFGNSGQIIMILIHQGLAKLQLEKFLISLQADLAGSIKPSTTRQNKLQVADVIEALSSQKTALPSEARINSVVNIINHLLHLADPALGIRKHESESPKLFDVKFLTSSIELVKKLDIKYITEAEYYEKTGSESSAAKQNVLELCNIDIIAFCYSLFYFAIDLQKEYVSARLIESGNLLRFKVFERFYFLKEKGSIANHADITNLPIAVLSCFMKHDCFTPFVESFLLSASHLSKFPLVKSILSNRRNSRYIDKLIKIDINNSKILQQHGVIEEALSLATSNYVNSLDSGKITRIALIRLKSQILSADLLEAKSWAELLIKNDSKKKSKNYISTQNHLLRVYIALGEYSHVRNIIADINDDELKILRGESLREHYNAMIRLKLLNYNINDQFETQLEIVKTLVKDEAEKDSDLTNKSLIDAAREERKKANNHIHLQILRCYDLMMEAEIDRDLESRNKKRNEAVIDIARIQNSLINIQYLSTSPFITIAFKISQLRCEIYKCHVIRKLPSEIYELKLRALISKTNDTYPLFHSSLLIMLADYLVFKRSFNSTRNHQSAKINTELLMEFREVMVQLSMVIEKHNLFNRLSELNKLGIFHQYEYTASKDISWLVC